MSTINLELGLDKPVQCDGPQYVLLHEQHILEYGGAELSLNKNGEGKFFRHLFSSILLLAEKMTFGSKEVNWGSLISCGAFELMQNWILFAFAILVFSNFGERYPRANENKDLKAKNGSMIPNKTHLAHFRCRFRLGMILMK